MQTIGGLSVRCKAPSAPPTSLSSSPHPLPCIPLTLVFTSPSLSLFLSSPPPASRRHQLCTSLEHIVKLDYPEKWTGVVDKVHSFLSSDTRDYWLGALLSLYQLARKYKCVCVYVCVCVCVLFEHSNKIHSCHI